MNANNDLSEQQLTHCPRCNTELTEWEQVLLGVDQELMCRNCWYRILIKPQTQNETDSEGETRL